MPYNSVTSRTDAAALIPEDASRDILQDVVDNGWLFQSARRLQNMPSAQRRMPVLSLFPIAYFVDGDTGLKQTTEITWDNKYIDAEEVAVIVPISQAVLDDADYDIWGEAKPLIANAFNKVITQAVLYGTGIPASWTTNLGAAGIVAFATAAPAVASAATFTDIYEAILGESAVGSADGLISMLEADGFLPNAHVAHTSVRTRLRNCRGTDGNPIFTRTPQDVTSYGLDGEPCYFPRDGSIDSSEALIIAGDWTQLVYSMRQEMTYTISSEATIHDAVGNPIWNLFQKDMVALRCVMRLGFSLPNPINYMEETEADRSPFAILTA